MVKQTRYWCLTINNPDNDYVVLFNELLMEYVVYQYEIGESGTKHIQMFLIMKKVVRMSGIKKLFPTAHIESMKGTPSQARAYCMKEDTRLVDTFPFEMGDFKNVTSGSRTDLQGICDMIKIKPENTEFQFNPTYIRNKRNIDQLIAEVQPERTFKPNVFGCMENQVLVKRVQCMILLS